MWLKSRFQYGPRVKEENESVHPMKKNWGVGWKIICAVAFIWMREGIGGATHKSILALIRSRELKIWNMETGFSCISPFSV